ncbi:Mdm33 family-domain-containing protein [Lasiosphaeris hirsuta]|uniref:Sensitive to high expression protein 9, mitochondrial n=1 Tax=Lasiosphaeris hirsuta TaxID=260670 RepID=A0AA40AEQ9_9PEZI|nr:Mdm33 family-domain-containing protein [Lasiosphaeris hirsuta]
MSPHTALRLAVHPLRRAALLDLSAPNKTNKTLSHLSAARRTAPRPSTPCLRCTFTRPAAVRFYSSSSPSSQKTPGDDNADADATSTSTSTPANTPPEPPRPEFELPSHAEDRRTHLSVRLSTMMDNFQTRLLNATQTINDLTGYSAIEAIKTQNTALEASLAAAQTRLRAARQNYKALTAHRASTQREVTTLLARKDTWSPPDLERFTSLYRLDHELEAQVATASAELTEAETDDSRLSAALNAGILRRYHEEQIWSDRIRRQSTWGTWGLMGVNILLFLVLQFVAEPWRRARLVKHIAEGEKSVIEDVRRELGAVRAALEASALRVASPPEPEAVTAPAAPEEVVATVAPAEAVEAVWEEEGLARDWKETLTNRALLEAAVRDLYSERRIDVRMRDISVIALEGAAAGASVVAALAFMLLRSSRS